MRKYLLFFLVMTCFVACSLFAACTDNSKAEKTVKLAVVDMQRLVRDSEPGKAAEKFWEGLVGGMRTKISGLESKLEKEPKNEALEKEFQTVYMQAQQRLQAEQQNMANLLNDAIQRSLNALREKKGYDVILDSEMVRAFGPAVDVTDAAIAEVNTQKVEFKPLIMPLEEGKTPEAGEAADKPDGDKPAASKPEEAKPAGQKAADSDKKPSDAAGEKPEKKK